jgi:hypothetical protein
MGISDLRVGLIGHSHAVCLLDALGNWRDQAGFSTAAQDQRYSEAFRGWFDVDLGGNAFTLAVGPTSFRAPAELVTCLLTAKTSGDLIQSRDVGGFKQVRATPLLARCVQQFRNIDLLVCALHGNEAANVSLIDNHPPYDFAPFDDNDALPLAPPPSQPIDRSHIARWVDAFAQPAILSVIALQRLFPSTRVVHVLPPPPLEDPAQVMRREVLEPRVPRRGALPTLLARHGFVRPSLRLKWSLAYRGRVQTALEAQGIQVMQAPHVALTAGGFLRKDLSKGLTHGNGHYGAMIWEALDSLVGTAQ